MTPITSLAAATLLRLAIYYGYPSLVENARGDISQTVATFSAYDVIVFGAGLEREPSGRDPGLDAERRKLPTIIAGLRAASRPPQIFGYIDLGRTPGSNEAPISQRVDRWQQVGADGIFFDDAGADFGVTPERRRAAVAAVHARGLAVFMNAFNPDDAFSDDDGAPPELRRADQLGPRDLLLIESFAVRNGEPEPAERTAARVSAAARWRERTGVRVFGITTTKKGTPFNADTFAEASGRARALKLDGFGWGEPDFSADSRLPWRSGDRRGGRR